MTLGDVLGPMPLAEFLCDYVGERHLVVKGERGRFHSLFSWQDVNDALNHLRTSEQRVSLVQRARPLPRESYVRTSQSGRVEYLDGPAVAKHIAAGATLVMNQVDELFHGVRQLAEACEQVFRVYVAANLYAGWRTDQGFDVHWDAHDTLIVQVKGQKDWKVWKPTRPHPLPGDGVDVAPPPTDDPIWQGTLQDGDALYMPRGWWHVARPRDELSVHVTLGIIHPTGVDLLQAMIERVRDAECVRMDVPHWKSDEERTAWMASVQEACQKALSGEALERFMARHDEKAHTRPFVTLPETLGAEPHLHDNAPLRLCRGRQLRFVSRNGSGLMFRVGGTHWACRPELRPALALLGHVKPCTLAEMKKVISDEARPLLRPYVLALMMADVIWAERVAMDVMSPGKAMYS